MAAPSKRCPFKIKEDDSGLQCEAANCMAYDTTNETCKILEYYQAMITYKDGGIDPVVVAKLINN